MGGNCLIQTLRRHDGFYSAVRMRTFGQAHSKIPRTQHSPSKGTPKIYNDTTEGSKSKFPSRVSSTPASSTSRHQISPSAPPVG